MTTQLHLHIGAAVQFKYNGGSNPGGLRTVYITGSNGNLLETYDFDKKGVRNFSIGLISGAKFISIARLKTDILPKDVTPILKGFEADGKVAFHDKTRGEIVTYTPPTYAINYGQGVIALSGPKGSISYNAVTGYLYGSNIITKRATAQEFIAAVQSLG